MSVLHVAEVLGGRKVLGERKDSVAQLEGQS
jgi:hypothetical protein